MAKLDDEDADVILMGDWLTVRAMRRTNGSYPAKEWAGDLNDRGTAQLHAAVRILETCYSTGRPPAGRVVLIQESRHRLLELRITPDGGTPPHRRLMYLRDETTLWAAHGFNKQKNKTPPKDIEMADRITDEWLTWREGA